MQAALIVFYQSHEILMSLLSIEKNKNNNQNKYSRDYNNWHGATDGNSGTIIYSLSQFNKQKQFNKIKHK